MSGPDAMAEHDDKRDRLIALDARDRAAVTNIGEGYSLFARLMRYALPIVAVVLLATVVIWPLISGREDGFRLSFTPANPIDSGPLVMENARYIGIDSQNQSYTVIAEQAIQESAEADLIELISPKADIILSDNGWLALTADRGNYLRASEILDLEGRVNSFSDEGFEMRTEAARVELALGRASGSLPVEGQGPLGVLNAVGFELIDGGATIRFGGPVRLVIYPGQEGIER
jgi:lipopolysaccharide export system protein LptC